MQFPRYFPFKKESACWLQILDEDILLKNWFTVLYLLGTRACNLFSYISLLCIFKCVELFNFIFCASALLK